MGSGKVEDIAQIVHQEQTGLDLLAAHRPIDPDGNFFFDRCRNTFASFILFVMLAFYNAMPHRSASILLILLLAFLCVPVLSQTSSLSGKLKSSPNLAVTEAGGWKTIHRGVEFRKMKLERKEPTQSIELKLVRFDPRRVVSQIVRSMKYQLRGANVKTLAEKSGAMAAINANYFDENGRPVGYLTLGETRINSQVSKSDLFTGIFGIRNFVPFIMHRDQFIPEQADEALQAGPLLLNRGKALEVTRGAGRKSRRALIALDSEQRILIAVVDTVLGGLSWVELQEIFSAPQWQLQTPDLLNLDGGGSAQMYVNGAQLKELVPGTTDVPVAIGFFPK